MKQQEMDDRLMDAVGNHDVDAVRELLEKSANPNCVRVCPPVNRNGKPDYSIPQPTTPLRMVMFCMSDALLNDGHRVQFAEIAKILLRYGADPKPAMEIAESRYGKYNPKHEKSAFQDVWDIIANASIKEQK